MWEYKDFKSQEDLDLFIANNSKKFQIREVFVNNSYCLEIKEKIVIDIL